VLPPGPRADTPRGAQRHRVAARRRAQAPRREGDHAEDERREDVAEGVADGDVTGRGADVDEHEPGVGPLLEPRRTGQEDRDQREDLRDAQDRGEVGGEAQAVEDVDDVGDAGEVPLDADGGLQQDRGADDPVGDGAEAFRPECAGG
jgi:hypothetical protein